MLEKLYELWSIEKRVSVTIKSVGLSLFVSTVLLSQVESLIVKSLPVSVSFSLASI